MSWWQIRAVINQSCQFLPLPARPARGTTIVVPGTCAGIMSRPEVCVTAERTGPAMFFTFARATGHRIKIRPRCEHAFVNHRLVLGLAYSPSDNLPHQDPIHTRTRTHASSHGNAFSKPHLPLPLLHSAILEVSRYLASPRYHHKACLNKCFRDGEARLHFPLWLFVAGSYGGERS